MSVAELDEFARKQWEGVLGYMVGSTGIDLASDGVKLSQGVKTLLQMGGLVEAKNRRVEITQDGFAFILQEINAQVWTVLILYLENAHKVCSIQDPLNATKATAKMSTYKPLLTFLHSWAWIPWTSSPFSSCSAALKLAKHIARQT